MQPPFATGTIVAYTSSRQGIAFQMEVVGHDAEANTYELSGVGPHMGVNKRAAAAAQVSLAIATEVPAEPPGTLPESETAAPGDQLARGSEGEDVAAVPTPDTEPTNEMALSPTTQQSFCYACSSWPLAATNSCLPS